MADLKTDYKDDVLDTTQNTKRKYQMIDNGDGTVSFEDVTEYLQQGDSFGADDTNATNTKVNALESDIDEINTKVNDLETDIDEIDDNLTEFVYLNPNVTTLEDMIDAFIASNQNNLKLGQECAVRMSNSPTSPGVYYAIKITRTSYDGERYYGYAFNYTDINKKYNFLKIGGASTVISPFKVAPTLIGSYSGNRTINVSSYLKSGDTVNNFIVEFVKINSGNSIWYDGNNQTVCQVRNLGSTLSKTLSGNNLIISGATNKDEVWKADNTSGSNPHGITAVNVNVGYKVWYV